MLDSPGGGGFQNPVATILPGQITTADIANGAITSIKLANNLQSDNYVPGVSGWLIERNTGNVEFGDGSFRGTITGGIFRTAATGNRMEINPAADVFRIQWFELGTTPAVASINYNIANDFFGISTVLGRTIGITADSDLFLFSANDDVTIGTIIGGNINLEPTNGAVRIPNGSDTLPAIGFTSDTDTGIYRAGTNILGLAGNVVGTGYVRGTNGVFVGPSNSNGMYWSGSALTITAGGTDSARFSGGYLTTLPFVVGGPALKLTAGNAALPAFAFHGTSGENMGMFRSSTDTLGWSTAGVARMLLGNSGLHVGVNLSGGLFIADNFPNVGNVETLRADRLGGGSLDTVQVGYFSSWITDPHTGKRAKVKVTDLAKSPLWNREWFDLIRPISFKRVSTKQHEIGFALDHLKALDDSLKYLTTKGDNWGESPDEFALLAVTILEVQDLRRRVKELETC